MENEAVPPVTDVPPTPQLFDIATLSAEELILLYLFNMDQWRGLLLAFLLSLP